MKSKRRKKCGSGVRKNSAGKNRQRRAKPPLDVVGELFVRHQAAGRWPTDKQENDYYRMNSNKMAINKAADGRIRPAEQEFALLEEIDLSVLDKLLTASCLRVKKIGRFPGWLLLKTYNMKEPIKFSTDGAGNVF